jgi:hypothetical protein
MVLLSIALLLPTRKYKGVGRKPYDYRLMLVLCILRVLLRKRYADYETEMRFDMRLSEMLQLKKLPCKSTVNNYDFQFKLPLLSSFNKQLIEAWNKKPVGSIWFCIEKGSEEGLRQDPYCCKHVQSTYSKLQNLQF